MNSLTQRFKEIDKLEELARGKESPSIPIIYKDASTGRYTALGGLLQSYHKSVRYAALEGCYEYDLDTAHQNILFQLLTSYDFFDYEFTKEESESLDRLHYYLEDKNDVRVNLAIDTNTDIAKTKEALQALTYGAQLADNPMRSINEILDHNEHQINKFINHPFTQAYANAFNLANKLLVGDKQTITNEVGITVDRRSKSKNLAHILQGYERSVIDAIIKHSNKDDIALLLHDCVVFYNQQDPKHLSDIVEKETGFSLQFSEELY